MSEDNAKKWFVIVADGKPLGLVLEGTPAYEKVRKYCQGLAGIQFYAALPEHLKKFASTIEAYDQKKAAAAAKRAEKRK